MTLSAERETLTISRFAQQSPESIRLGMAATIYRWALHLVYGIVALALSPFSFNKGLPLTIRSVFYPIFGERFWGWWGHVIDTIAVFATLFGLATSLGFGATQANAGLKEILECRSARPRRSC